MLYWPRLIDLELDELLTGLTAVSIEGPRAIGKTETASRRASTIFQLDDPGQLEVVRASPGRLTRGPIPILIDEWQRFPVAWDLVRRAVDTDPSPARFLLTGSAAPSRAPTHSGAGRIVTLRMRPMSLAERSLDTPTVRLGDLLTGTRPELAGRTTIGVESYTEEILRSGFPAIRTLSGRRLRSQLDGYIDRMVDRDFPEAGYNHRNKGALRRWLAAYAAASSTTASFEVIRDAATPGEGDKPARSTTLPYRSTLEQLWMIDEVPAWTPSRNQLRRLGKSPVHQLADPALAARLLGLDIDTLLDGRSGDRSWPHRGPMLGALFESLVTLSIRTYAQVNEARVGHLRTRSGEHEIDLIVERADGRVVALEVKLSATVDDHDTQHLRWLRHRIGDDLLDAAIITTGTDAYRRADGIGVIPAVLMTA